MAKENSGSAGRDGWTPDDPTKLTELSPDHDLDIPGELVAAGIGCPA